MEEFMGLRVYRCGKIERKIRGKYWREVNNEDTIKVNGKTYFQKRFVMAAFNPEFDISNPELHVIHIDGNKKNKTFENLKIETLEERKTRDTVRNIIGNIIGEIEWKAEQRAKQEYYLKAVAAGGYANL